MSTDKKFILVTGGSRSGKSSYALDRAIQVSNTKTFIATCPPIGPNMEERIDKHKDERLDGGWITIEEQQNISYVRNNKTPKTMGFVGKL